MTEISLKAALNKLSKILYVVISITENISVFCLDHI